MLDFYRVLIRIDGTIIHDIFATNHDDLVTKYSKSYDLRNRNYIKAMYSPKQGYRLDDVDYYEIIIVDNHIPDWFYKLKSKIEKSLYNLIKSMIVSGYRDLILGEGVILNKKAKINTVKESVIFAMYDDSYITIFDKNSQMRRMCDNSIINKTCDSTKITLMEGFARINEMHDYSSARHLKDRSSVGKMFDHSFIGKLYGTSQVGKMLEDAQAEVMGHMSRVIEMHDFTNIEELRNFSVVEKMFDNSRINFMRDSSKVEEMYGNSIIEYKESNASVSIKNENSLIRRFDDAANTIRGKLDI